MRQTLRFAVILLVGLGLAAWLASRIVHETTSAWFKRDLDLRARLALSGAREALAERWQSASSVELGAILAEITHDERILAAGACAADLKLLARTPEFSEEIACADLGWHVRPSFRTPAGAWVVWHTTRSLPGGKVHVSALPVIADGRALGFLVLLHDLSFVERRDAETRSFLWIAFGFLALAASAITVGAVRLSWRSWSADLRRLLRGGANKPEFQPIMSDVRELVDRLVSETRADDGGAWTPGRLKQTLGRYLHGEKVILVANREPYVHERAANGEIVVLHPASGLVSALEPVMRACSGVWIAHGSGSADRETADRTGRIAVPPGEESYALRRIWLTPDEEKGYYYGFSNEGLWPLCHIADARPTFRRADWEHYKTVNGRFADAARSEVDSRDPIILVQDYHFALVPRLVRERLPGATAITFWHIPWPNSERFAICPWREELLRGMLGSSIIGFHTQFHCNNFLESVDRFLEARIDREQDAVIYQGRSTLVRPYPISLEWPSRWVENLPAAAECRASVFAQLRLRGDALLGVGVDRLDYTKGIEERLLAVERLLERYPDLRGRFTFVQLAAPSRTGIDRYQQLNDAVAGLVERINTRFATVEYSPIVLLRAHHEPPQVFRFYRAADLVYVSSLHDGMNLVAKEFVSAREDERGALVLSEFTGAARELTEALIVNPYDLEQASSAIYAALHMPVEEQRDRMRSMRGFLSEFNVYRWAGRMLVDAARLRRRSRLSERLNDRFEAVPVSRR